MFLVKDAKKRAEEKGVEFNETESRKKNEAWWFSSRKNYLFKTN